ncbi:MAG: alpha/beta hydrolase, partial [Acidimicrobiia bacterium]|nr:alpha/beta hydrolase [Acidimicrobiia bacterium]
GTSMATVTVDPPPDADVIPLPSWDSWQEAAAALDGLDDAALEEFRLRAVAEPAGVARSRVVLGDPARLSVPASVVCTSIPSDQLRELVAAGHLPSEIVDVEDTTWIDLPTGHWPMFSRPADLAAIIASEAVRSPPENG